MGAMLDEVILDVAGESIPVTLLRDAAPRTCQAIEAALPLEGTVNHARLAGDEIMFPVRFYVAPENQSQAQEEANVAYWPERMIICVFYGGTDGVGKTNVFGRVTGNLDGLRRAGEHVWRHQGEVMRIRAGT